MYNFRPCFVFLLFLIPFCLFGQSNHFGIINYNTTNGLPQNSITGIQFDQNGFCWLSCELGLIRYDGLNFKVFNNENIKGLQSIRFRRSFKTSDGEIFFINDKNQLIHINISSHKFAPFPQLLDTKKQQALFYRKYPFNFYSFQNKIKQLQSEYPKKKGIDLNFTNDRHAYLKLDNYLFYLNDDKFQKIDEAKTDFYDVQNVMVGQYYISVHSKSTSFRVYKDGLRLTNFTNITGPVTNNPAFRSGNVKLIRGNDAGYLYSGTSLYKLNVDPHHGLSSKLIISDLSIKAIDNIFYNKDQQKYYIGSAVNGLYILSRQFFNYYEVNDEIVRRGFYSQLLLPDQSIICQRYVYRPDNTIDTLKNLGLMSISSYLHQNQYIYYGNENLLYKYNLRTQKPELIHPLESNIAYIKNDIQNPDIINVFTQTDFYQLKDDVIILHQRVLEKRKKFITTVFQDAQNNFIIGTEEGLIWYNKSDKKITHHALDSVYIRSIYQDKDGRLWISSYNKGIFLLEDNKTTAFPTTPFAGLKSVHAFIDDKTGSFFLPSNNGLFRVKISDLLKYAKNPNTPVRYYMYSMEDHLKSNEFNGGCIPAFVWLKDGALSIPSIMGIVRFYPNQFNQPLPDKKIYISELTYNQLYNNYFKDGTLHLLQRFSDMKLDVTTPFYGNKNNLRLLYRINGWNKEWVKVPDNGEIIFNHLPYGKYTIEIRHLFDVDESTANTLQLKLNVIPPFYNSLWFYDLLIIFAILIIYIVVWLRTRLLRRNNQNLKRKIEEQTKVLQSTIEKLEVSEQRLIESNKLKDQVTTMILHDLRSPIRFVQMMATQLDKNYNKLSVEILEQRVSALKSSTTALNEFTEQFFTWAASQHSNFRVNKEMFDLMALLSEIKHLYKDIVVINGNEIIIEPCYIIVLTDRQILSTIVRNIVDNSNKITKQGRIRISATIEGGGVCIYISDNGPGFKPDKLRQFIEGNHSTNNGGHGSIILNNLIHLISAKFEVFSEEGVGSIFKISLPQLS